jgi:ankyrin repeat protein
MGEKVQIQSLPRQAITSGFSDIVHVLLRHEGNIHAKDSEGSIQSFYAARFGHQGMMGLFLRELSGTDTPNTFCRTPLMLAATGKNRDTSIAIGSSADTEYKGCDGRTAMYFAVWDSTSAEASIEILNTSKM